ncbi:MAG: SPOR domain-containing protein [Gammaproteobacteria bacterium]|nr:MAG: SPOR domain-containing protein [Gammaproteobacteria bacterium]
MPRDYAKSQHKEQKPMPGWVWMLAGLMIGLFVALLVYIKDNSSGKLNITETVSKVFQTKKQTDARRVKKDISTPPAAPSKSSKPKFDFYTILPELEVAIPEQELIATDSGSSNSAKSIQKYMLQAGSFKQFEEADKLKARLALQGIEAHIQKVKINDTDTWHRVRIGPLNNIKALNQTRRRLRDLGIASIVVRNKS